MKRKITPEEFVRTWQTAKTREEVAAALDLPVNTIDARAASYRKHGVPMKHLPTLPKRVDWEKLATFAKSLLTEAVDG